VEHLLVPSYVSPPGYMRPWACRWLRNRLGVEAKPAGKRRLWISRSRARWRRLINEEELLPILKKAGFEPVELERLSFKDQVKTLSQAGVVAGPHGAGMTDLLFAPHGIRVLELFSPGFVNPVFYSMANALEQDYGYAVGETLPEDRHPGGSKDLDHFRLSPDRLRAALRMMKLAS
jgi:capsular polysaccharide biosynthesis protein